MINQATINNSGTPSNNINGSLVNIDDSHTGGIPFNNTKMPNIMNPNVLPLPGSNVLSARSIIPGLNGGSKINRKKINKISRKYKMKGSRKSVSRRVRKMKSKVRSKYARRHRNRSRKMRGGGLSPPASAPTYPAGHSQYQNNQPSDVSYALGGKLPASLSGMANPPPISGWTNAAVDNLNHATLNAYGNTGSGSGFPSRGWY